MAKVYLNVDSHQSFFIWDKEALAILDRDNYLVTIEIPDELLLEYTDVMEQYGKLQEKLRKYYDCKRINQKT